LFGGAGTRAARHPPSLAVGANKLASTYNACRHKRRFGFPTVAILYRPIALARAIFGACGMGWSDPLFFAANYTCDVNAVVASWNLDEVLDQRVLLGMTVRTKDDDVGRVCAALWDRAIMFNVMALEVFRTAAFFALRIGQHRVSRSFIYQVGAAASIATHTSRAPHYHARCSQRSQSIPANTDARTKVSGPAVTFSPEKYCAALLAGKFDHLLRAFVAYLSCAFSGARMGRVSQMRQWTGELFPTRSAGQCETSRFTGFGAAHG
jgi:hypothetical protein